LTVRVLTTADLPAFRTLHLDGDHSGELAARDRFGLASTRDTFVITITLK